MSVTISKEYIIVFEFQGDCSVPSSQPLLRIQQGHSIEGIDGSHEWTSVGSRALCVSSMTYTVLCRCRF